jgi:hypothetical protein
MLLFFGLGHDDGSWTAGPSKEALTAERFVERYGKAFSDFGFSEQSDRRVAGQSASPFLLEFIDHDDFTFDHMSSRSVIFHDLADLPGFPPDITRSRENGDSNAREDNY